MCRKTAVIIADAGCAKRFNKGLREKTLKALYREPPFPCILELQLSYLKGLSILVVGGYKFKELEQFLSAHDIKSVYNKDYRLGSLRSFICGLQSLEGSYDQLLFMEGDIVFDKETIEKIISIPSDVITTSPDMIRNESVIFTVGNKLTYHFDEQHSLLRIEEPFSILGNSGQVWKFIDLPLLKSLITNEDGTNLILIENYYNKRLKSTKFIPFKRWFNCNEIQDYRRAMGID